MRRCEDAEEFLFYMRFGCKSSSWYCSEGEGGDGQLRPEFLKLSQVATETPSLRSDDDAIHKMRDGPLLIVA